MHTPAAIDVRELSKDYGDLTAVDGVSFTVPASTTFAFLGTNGAGKTTTISCLTTLVTPTCGNAQICGYDVRTQTSQARQQIGVVFQDSLLDPAMTVHQNLEFRARLHKLTSRYARKRIAVLADWLEFSDFAHRHYGQLSGGQRRRVDIARALLHEPRVLFLDEPTTGLDPSSRASVWQAIHNLRIATGLTVFLTTHYMEETEQADHVCIIDAGRVIAEGTPGELRATYSRSILEITSARPRTLATQAEEINCPASIDGAHVRIEVPDATSARRLLSIHGSDVTDFEFRHGRMDDVFLALTAATYDADNAR